MRVSGSILIAVGIALLGGGTLLYGYFSGAEDKLEVQKPPADVSAAKRTPSVRVETIVAKPHRQDVVLRGATEARRTVDLKAETHGRLDAMLVAEGASVRQGEPLAQLDRAERSARLREAEALLRQRKVEFDASQKLAAQGYRAETDRAGAEASLEAAEAAVEAARLSLQDTTLRAPFSGLVERHLMEIGDYAERSDPMLRLVQLEPLRVAAFADEGEVLRLRRGMPAEVGLSDGRNLEGVVAFVAQQGEAGTRTFRIEVEVGNPGYRIPAGVTADIVVPVSSTSAQKISPAVLSLDSKGRLGAKVVDQDDTVRFLPVEIVDDEADGVWVTGLPERARLITVGQEFVTAGQTVRVVEVGGEEAPGGRVNISDSAS